MKDKIKFFMTKLGDILRKVEDAFAIGGMVIFGAVIMVEIVRRALGASGISWLQEFSQLMFVLSVFIGCTRAVESDDHMAMDVLYRIIPNKYMWPVRALVDFLMIIISVFLFYFSLKYTIYTYKVGTSVQTISAFKMWIIWVPIVFCLFTMTLRYIIVFVNRLRDNILKICKPQLKEAQKEV